ncbi:unnamed protein product [Fusarium graminearum]|nr:hypothetical protein FGRA07_08007 [Fusarium graminearum]CZS73573.1 unnamed protein product [Fusarium graminearum]
MSRTDENPYPSPDEPEFQKKFRAFILKRVLERHEAQPSPKTFPFEILPSEKPTSLPSIHTLNSEEPPSIPPVGAVHDEPPPAKSTSTAATTDKKVDEGNLEARLGKKIDDAFALLDERLDKEFQLLHHIMVATWEGA